MLEIHLINQSINFLPHFFRLHLVLHLTSPSTICHPLSLTLSLALNLINQLTCLLEISQQKIIFEFSIFFIIVEDIRRIQFGQSFQHSVAKLPLSTRVNLHAKYPLPHPPFITWKPNPYKSSMLMVFIFECE